jgi:hypothetical protein
MPQCVSYIRHQSLHNISYRTLALAPYAKVYTKSGEMAQIALFFRGDAKRHFQVTIYGY